MPSVSSVREFLEQYNSIFPKIYNYVYRGLLHAENAEDITATVFEKALKYIKTHDVTIENFQAWMYKIATNEINSHHKKKKGKTTVSIDEDEAAAEKYLRDVRHDPAQFAQFDEIQQAISRLKPDEASLVRLHYFEGHDYAELEEILEVKQVTLRSQIHRILKKLQRLLGEGPG
jgi:RNA polymerase sigma-70 factor (ECF subfamily)